MAGCDAPARAGAERFSTGGLGLWVGGAGRQELEKEMKEFSKNRESRLKAGEKAAKAARAALAKAKDAFKDMEVSGRVRAAHPTLRPTPRDESDGSRAPDGAAAPLRLIRRRGSSRESHPTARSRFVGQASPRPFRRDRCRRGGGRRRTDGSDRPGGRGR